LLVAPIKLSSQPTRPVRCESRIYPELDTEELMKHAAIEDIQSEDGSFSFKDPRVAQHTFGWRISMDYINHESGEIIHRFEITQSTKAELVVALYGVVYTITNLRQRHVFEKWLQSNQAGLAKLLHEE